jgi:Amiloride-sensitive sodium channel
MQNMRALSFIVYVDDFNSFIAKKIDVNPRRSVSTGIRVTVHERGTSPETSSGVSAAPGTETSIIVSPVYRQRLEKPYDGCSNNRQSHSEGDPLYTASYCVKLCLQNTVRKCSCMQVILKRTKEVSFSCFNFSAFSVLAISHDCHDAWSNVQVQVLM